MAKPIVSSTDIEPKSLPFLRGRWTAEYNEPVILSLAVESSGIDDPYVRLNVAWGDGDVMRIIDPFPIKRAFQYHHVYEEAGNYDIVVRATNADGEESDLSGFTSVPVRVAQQREQNKDISRWAGLALPTKRIAQGLSVVESVIPPETVTLGVDAKKGATQIIALGDGEAFIGDAPSISISEPGKLISSARVVGRNLNVIELDRDLKDDYTANIATIEVARREYSRGKGLPVHLPDDWFFPADVDRVLIRSAISMILSTAPYERVMLPSFGSLLHEVPFEQADDFTETKLQRAVVDAISTWEDRVDVVGFEIRTDPSNNQMTLFVSLQEVSDFSNNPFTLDFDLVNPSA